MNKEKRDYGGRERQRIGDREIWREREKCVQDNTRKRVPSLDT